MKKTIQVTMILFLTLMSGKVYAPIDLITQEITFHRSVLMTEAAYNLQSLFEALAISETGDINTYPKKICKKVWQSPYHVVNSIGAWGRWQQTYIARKDIGYSGTKTEFLRSPDVQKNCLIKLLKKNKKYLQYYIPDYQDYIGTTIHGVEITYSGLLSACFFGGIGNTIKFLKTGYNATDGNKTVRDYIQIGKGYAIGLII